MENRQQYAEDDPRHHTLKIKGMLNDIRNHLRETEASEPQRWISSVI